jgi:DNA phosphorothioation-dependent restriction protein DptG
MVWQQALVDQEVLELYFFPLLRSMSKIKPDGFYLTYGSSVKQKNTASLDYLLSSLILNGEAVVSSATGTMNSYEAGYAVLALLDFGGSTYHSL